MILTGTEQRNSSATVTAKGSPTVNNNLNHLVVNHLVNADANANNVDCEQNANDQTECNLPFLLGLFIRLGLQQWTMEWAWHLQQWTMGWALPPMMDN